jgi:hypothetical protein
MLLGHSAGRRENWSSIPIMGGYFSFLCRVHTRSGVHEVLCLVGIAVHGPGVMRPDSEADG